MAKFPFLCLFSHPFPPFLFFNFLKLSFVFLSGNPCTDLCFQPLCPSRTVGHFHQNGKDPQLDGGLKRSHACAWYLKLQSSPTRKIGRLPFDLSNFKEEKPNLTHHEAFIRAYHTYLDRKSLLMLQHSQEQKEGSLRKGIRNKPKQWPMMQDLVWLQRLQGLLDMLLKIRPQKEKMTNNLILEAMDCIVVEVFNIYSRICNAIAAVLVRIYSVGNTEAAMAFSVLQKEADQAKDLSQYITFVGILGLLKHQKAPKLMHIRDEDIQTLEHIIEHASNQRKTKDMTPKEEDKKSHDPSIGQHLRNPMKFDYFLTS